jgi:hypothetical protein
MNPWTLPCPPPPHFVSNYWDDAGEYITAIASLSCFQITKADPEGQNWWDLVITSTSMLDLMSRNFHNGLIENLNGEREISSKRRICYQNLSCYQRNPSPLAYMTPHFHPHPQICSHILVTRALTFTWRTWHQLPMGASRCSPHSCMATQKIWNARGVIDTLDF